MNLRSKPCIYYGKTSTLISLKSLSPTLFSLSGSSQKVTVNCLVLNSISLNHAFFTLSLSSKQFLQNPSKINSFLLIYIHSSCAVHGVAKSQTRLSNFTFTFHLHALEKERATYSSVLAWRIPGTGEPGGLPSMGSHRVGHD